MSKKQKKKTVLVISDTQAPFHHQDTVPFLKAVKKKYEPDHIVHIGDFIDAYCLSDYVRNPDAISAVEEIGKAKEFVRDLGKIFPNMDIVEGNHCQRLQRAFRRAGIPGAFMKTWKEVLCMPKGWNWHLEFQLDGVLYQHGNESGAGGQVAAQRRAMLNGRNTVAGHLHMNASIMYFANRETLLWGMHVGSLIDHKAIAFEYSHKSLRKPILSIGLVIDGTPMLIPMVLDKNGRWVGKL